MIWTDLRESPYTRCLVHEGEVHTDPEDIGTIYQPFFLHMFNRYQRQKQRGCYVPDNPVSIVFPHRYLKGMIK